MGSRADTGRQGLIFAMQHHDK
ncbi:hypothetical protein AGR13a_Lc100041 [Agrobacterium genomosp. 13 str. CFBP 6927]|uniref:Uncharacterized protein n=1 Tax=Agrobacterium genomosp. 13 str. CFBP 6927 TaxID=1183428 RepID=A0ABM9VIR0_9HYPH|nr:hypothetical protein AGR13a_Lc100041 [Agrobacterium genomosp. 13 str. CFBP 6927]